MYFTQINNWSDKSYYNMMNFKRIILPLGILSASLIVRSNGHLKLANMILFIPVGILLVFSILGIFVMYLFSLSVPSK
jgi:glycopeptide antibiotics resistance protein